MFSKKPVGIIGGMGPEASILLTLIMMDEEGAVATDQQHVPFILYSECRIPDRSAYLTGDSDEDPYPALAEVVRTLSRSCSVLLLPCNTAHHWYDDLQEISDVPIIHMVRESGLMVPGNEAIILSTLGTQKQGIYDDVFRTMQKSVVYPVEMEAVQQCIWEIKAREFCKAEATIAPVLQKYRDRNLPIIFGCTEFSVLYRQYPDLFQEYLTIDPMRVLARTAINLYRS